MGETQRDDSFARWTRLVKGIRADDSAAAAELYKSLNGFKSFFGRKLGAQEADDRYHDLIMAIIAAIQDGALREPARLAAYARAVAGHIVADCAIALKRVRQLECSDGWRAVVDHAPTAEATAIRREAKAIAARVLAAMPARDRAVLVRFYVYEDEPSCIRAELGLSETQFRLIKSRAKARFTSMLQRRIGPRVSSGATPS